MSDLVYLYGFVPADARPPDALAGIAGRPVRLLPLEGFQAAWSPAPEGEFGSEALESRLRDLGWVGDQGALHERVVTWFVDHAHIVPVRLLTLYSGEEALRRAAGEGAPLIRGQLERTRGHREWDLKVSYRREVLAEHLGELSDAVGELDRQRDAAEPGRRYLLERKRDKLVAQETRRTARALGRNLLESAAAHARRTREVPPPRTEAELPVVLSAALLVPEEEEGALRAALEEEAERLDRVGVRVELSGPWAPYRFLGDEEPGEEAPDDGEAASYKAPEGGGKAP